MPTTQQIITRKLIDAYRTILDSKPPTREANQVLRQLISISQSCPDAQLAQDAHAIVASWSGKIPRVSE